MKKFLYLSLSLFLLTLSVVLFMRFRSVENGSNDEYYRSAFQEHNQIYSPFIPDSLNFCGENVPLEYSHVYERLDREMLVNLYWQSNIVLLLKRAHRFFGTIEPILKEKGIPDDFKYLALAESGFIHASSSAGASGFWQFMKPTAERYGLEVNNEIDERYHLPKATEAACAFIQSAYRNFGSWTLAAAAYNTGEGNIRRHITNQSETNYYHMHLPEETMRYVFRILALKTIFENPTEYGIILRKKDLYPPYQVQSLRVDTTISSLFDFARQQQVSYQLLKAYNPWLRSNNLPNKSRKVYLLDIPVKTSLLRKNVIILDDEENILQEIHN